MSTSSTAPAKPRIAYLCLAIFFAAVGFALLAPTRIDIAIIFKEVMTGLGVTSLAAAGFLTTATLVGEGLMEMLTGGFSDRWGRMWTLVVGLVVYSIFGILTAVSVPLPVTYLFRILLGVGQAIYVPAYLALIGGIHAERRGLLVGSLGGVFTIGVAVNPLFTVGMFRATGHWQAPFIGYGIFGLALAVCIYLVGRGWGKSKPVYETRFRQPPAPAETHEKSPFSWLFNRNMSLLFITMLMWGFTQYGFLGLFVHYLRAQQHFTLSAARDVAEIAGWSAFFWSFVAGYFSDHIGRRWSLMIFGTIALIFAPLIFILPQSFASAAIFAAIFQACNGVFFPLGNAYAQDCARADHLGAHSGLVTGIGHLIAGFSGLILGAVAASFGWATAGWVIAALSLLMVIAIGFTRDPRRAAARQLAPQTL